jgi:F0F1-type ATP synthase assembly protein I
MCEARTRIAERIVPLPFRIVAIQGGVTAALAMMFLVFDQAQAVASLIAGVVVIVPGSYFAWRVVAMDAARGDELNAARRLLGSGVAKLVMTFGLLVVAFAWVRPAAVAFFATMIVLQAVYWLAPVFERR